MFIISLKQRSIFMAGVLVNPEDLERFINELKVFTSQLRDSTARLNGQFVRVSDTWRDQEQVKFAREFEHLMRVLQQFTQSADKQIPVLQRKAKFIRDYME
jgi:hypothetical protein